MRGNIKQIQKEIAASRREKALFQALSTELVEDTLPVDPCIRTLEDVLPVGQIHQILPAKDTRKINDRYNRMYDGYVSFVGLDGIPQYWGYYGEALPCTVVERVN